MLFTLNPKPPFKKGISWCYTGFKGEGLRLLGGQREGMEKEMEITIMFKVFILLLNSPSGLGYLSSKPYIPDPPNRKPMNFKPQSLKQVKP